MCSVEFFVHISLEEAETRFLRFLFSNFQPFHIFWGRSDFQPFLIQKVLMNSFGELIPLEKFATPKEQYISLFLNFALNCRISQ